jgi:HD-like signal output (HDOD) protein
LSGVPKIESATAAHLSSNVEAFEFVRELAAELSGGAITLPSYPDVAMRVQRVLADEDASNERVVRVMGAEPVLASRVLAMANSVAMNPTGKPVADLRSAVTRLGFDALRATVVGYAMTQLRSADQFKDIVKVLMAQWTHSVWMSATSFVIARRQKRGNPDTAMLAGLLEGVGKLYILTRASRHAALFADAAVYHGIVRDWHASIARAVLEQWRMNEEIIVAVQGSEQAGREERGYSNLADILAASTLLLTCREAPEMLALQLPENLAAQRLNITMADAETLVAEAAVEVAALREALGH